MRLLGDDELERSAIVANCRMNRERDLAGSNGYDRELGFNPLDFLRGRAAQGRETAWLDLCCGTGRALIQGWNDRTAETAEPAEANAETRRKPAGMSARVAHPLEFSAFPRRSLRFLR